MNSRSRTTLLYLLCALLPGILPAQGPGMPVRKLDRSSYEPKVSELTDAFGQNKFIYPEYKVAILAALTYFPELRGVSVDFVPGNIGTTMQCRPSVHSLLSGNEQRDYIVEINQDESFMGVLLKNAPFNAQVGVIGHELTHILDYEKKNVFGVIERGLEYFQDESKRKYEIEIDSLTIARGLGWQLFDWADFVLNRSGASEEYKAFKRSIYLAPEQIREQIRRNRTYENCPGP